MKRQQGGRGEGKEGEIFTFPPFPLSPFLPCFLSKWSDLESISLNNSRRTLISLTILLTIPVDKAVDKLWISCG